MRFGKILSHWFFKIYNESYWGFPKIIDDIQTEPENVKLFVYSLYLHKI